LTRPLRFLLDQQFPPARFDIHALDRSVEYVHLSEHNPAYSTLDRSQLDEEAELVALASSRVSVITWSRGDEDPIVLWGQLLAYMPQIVKTLATVAPAVITLPNPRLEHRRNVDRPEDLVRGMQERDKVSYPERRARAVGMMNAELEKRGESALARHLEKKPGRSKQKRATKSQDG
jgi:hypothetical protein